jgi:hypothetical protein
LHGTKTSSVENTTSNRVKVYPNPAHDFLIIDTESPCEVAIYDCFGKTLLEREIAGSEKVNISNLPTGVYFIRITAKGLRAVKKVIRM